MSQDQRKPASEAMHSLNRELIDCDFDDLTAEELERRLELMIASLPVGLESQCGSENYCNGFSGSGNCQAVNTCHTFS